VASITDSVVTVFRTLGERETQDAYRSAGTAAAAYQRQIDTARRQQVGYAAAFGASLAVLGAYGNAVLAAAEDQVTFQRAAGNFRGAFPKEEVEAFTGSLQTLTGIDDDKIAATVGVLGTFQLSPSLARDLTLPILNASESLKALGLTSESVAAQVGKAVQTGNATSLRRAGIVIDTEQFKAAATEAERVRIIIAALDAQGGQAAVQFRDSLPGALQALGSEFHSLEENIGSGGINPLRFLTEGAVSVVRAVNAIPGPVLGAAGAIGAGLAAAVLVYSGATLLALGRTIHLGEEYLKAAAKAGTLTAATKQLTTAQQQQALPSGALAGGVGVGGAAAAAGKPGFLAAGGIGRAAGAAGLVGLVLSLLPDTGNAAVDIGKSALAGAATGFGLGATVGSIVPGLGTAAGGAIGGIVGGGLGFFQGQAAQDAKQQAAGGGGADQSKDEQIRLLQQQLDEMRRINENTRPRAGALSFSDLPGREQFGSIFD